MYMRFMVPVLSFWLSFVQKLTGVICEKWLLTLPLSLIHSLLHPASLEMVSILLWNLIYSIHFSLYIKVASYHIRPNAVPFLCEFISVLLRQLILSCLINFSLVDISVIGFGNVIIIGLVSVITIIISLLISLVLVSSLLYFMMNTLYHVSLFQNSQEDGTSRIFSIHFGWWFITTFKCKRPKSCAWNVCWRLMVL